MTAIAKPNEVIYKLASPMCREFYVKLEGKKKKKVDEERCVYRGDCMVKNNKTKQNIYCCIASEMFGTEEKIEA